eukprot:SAG11_NODE_25320_length_360_cov_0.980843_1_plen_22_part_10
MHLRSPDLVGVCTGEEGYRALR